MNNCEHWKTHIEEGFSTCICCGQVIERVLETSEMTFADSQNRTVQQVYSRNDRFHRLLANIRGWQTIKVPEMQEIASYGHFETVGELREALIENGNKKNLNKIATVWRQLGNKFTPPSQTDFLRAADEFRKIRGKTSYILLVPYILEKIGRADLCRFCKKPTRLLQKKYQYFVNESNWD